MLREKYSVARETSMRVEVFFLEIEKKSYVENFDFFCEFKKIYLL